MASDVDICNLALAQLGDAAQVSNISPPDSSAQAGHCARFYPIARDALLAMHTWNFATMRVTLASVALPPDVSTWYYAYALPSDMMEAIAILDPSAVDDETAGLQLVNAIPQVPSSALGVAQPQPFVIESYNGSNVLLTNVSGAVLRYTAAVHDSAKYSPLFVVGLSTLLAAFLAGPVLKGAEGRNAKAAKMQEFMEWKAMAVDSDSNQREQAPTVGAAWMLGR